MPSLQLKTKKTALFPTNSQLLWVAPTQIYFSYKVRSIFASSKMKKTKPNPGAVTRRDQSNEGKKY